MAVVYHEHYVGKSLLPPIAGVSWAPTLAMLLLIRINDLQMEKVVFQAHPLRHLP